MVQAPCSPSNLRLCSAPQKEWGDNWEEGGEKEWIGELMLKVLCALGPLLPTPLSTWGTPVGTQTIRGHQSVLPHLQCQPPSFPQRRHQGHLYLQKIDTGPSAAPSLPPPPPFLQAGSAGLWVHKGQVWRRKSGQLAATQVEMGLHGKGGWCHHLYWVSGTQIKRRPCDHRGSDWSDVAISQGVSQPPRLEGASGESP